MYKNILITSTSRDNLGTSYSFYKSLDQIVDMDLQEMIKACIENRVFEKEDLWSSDNGMCGSDRGYVFGETSVVLPITIEHLIDYVF